MTNFDSIRQQLLNLPEVVDGSVRVYTDVPVSAIVSSKGGVEPEQSGIIDLLYCKDKMVLLAIMTHVGGHDFNMSELFPGIPYIYLRTDAPDTLPPLFDRLRELYLKSPGSRISEYSLSACYADELLLMRLRHINGDLPLLLKQKHLCFENGAPSDYGIALGLFQESGCCCKRYLVAKQTMSAFRYALNWMHNANTSLSARLQNLRNDLPSSGDFGEHLAQKIQVLLNTSLSRLMKPLPDHMHELAALFTELGSLETTTYYQAITQINKWYTCGIPESVQKAEDSLIILAQALNNYENSIVQTPDNSLFSRLAAQCYPVDDIDLLLAMPLSHLCYGAATNITCDYPNWLYRTKFCKIFNINDSSNIPHCLTMAIDTLS